VSLKAVVPAVVCLIGLAPGCAHDSDYPRGTIRVIGGQRVLGRYISPSAYQHYIQAQLYISADAHEGAIDELRQAIASDPESPELRTTLARELVKQSRLDAADLEIAQALRTTPDFADAFLAQALTRRARGDLAGSIESLARAVKADPEDEDAAIELARAQHEAGDPAASRATLQALCERLPQSTEGRYHYANALAGSGDWKAAVTQLRRTLELDPSHIQARLRLAEVLVGAGRAPDAIEVLREGLDASDDPLPVAEPLVELLLRDGELEAARDVLTTIDHDEKDPVRLVALANLFRAVKQPERARELCEAALHAQPQFDRARLLSAALYEEASNPAAAVGEYRKVPISSKDFPDALRRLADLLRPQGRLAEVVKLAEDAVSKRPQDDDLVVITADLEEKRGDPARGIKRLEAAVAARPKSETLLYGLGSAVDRAGDWRRGIEIMRRVLALNPKNASALNFIGYSYSEHGVELSQAERMLRQAIGLSPGNGYIVDSLGWCLFKQGKPQEALRVLQEADRLTPGEAEILRHLGDVYVALKDRVHAADHYRRALKGSPDDKLRRDLEDALRDLEADRSARRP
jgi:tetratricopeptide (TPR) repeat protein